MYAASSRRSNSADEGNNSPEASLRFSPHRHSILPRENMRPATCMQSNCLPARHVGAPLIRHSQACDRDSALGLLQRRACEQPTRRLQCHSSNEASEAKAVSPGWEEAADAQPDVGQRDDDVLPDSLGDALKQSGEATDEALKRGVTRCLVEILLPEFWDPSSGAVFAEEGDQQRFWKLTRRFVDGIDECEPGRKIRLVYPDSGVAALLKNAWRDLPYRISSLTDRFPIDSDDELVIVAAPDPQGLDKCKKLAADLDDERPMVLFNPRLASGDVGVGLNIRRMRSRFLSTFTTTYSLRPVGDIGSVFRRYPSMWQVFVEDSAAPGRFRRVAEQPSRPAGENLDMIIMDALGEADGANGSGDSGKKSWLGQLQSTVESLQRFAKQLSQ